MATRSGRKPGLDCRACFLFRAEDGIRGLYVTGVQTCALPISVLAGWPAATAWAVQPVVELFLVVGSLEIVCRAWEGRTDLRYPTALIAAALVVVLAANVADHVLQAAAERRSGPMLAVVGLLAALVPAAQLGSLHLISGRLHSLGGRTTGSPAAASTLADTVPSADIHPSQDTAATADVLVAADNRTDTDGCDPWPPAASGLVVFGCEGVSGGDSLAGRS